jgi:hypothetical protein
MNKLAYVDQSLMGLGHKIEFKYLNNNGYFKVQISTGFFNFENESPLSCPYFNFPRG